MDGAPLSFRSLPPLLEGDIKQKHQLSALTLDFARRPYYLYDQRFSWVRSAPVATASALRPAIGSRRRLVPSLTPLPAPDYPGFDRLCEIIANRVRIRFVFLLPRRLVLLSTTDVVVIRLTTRFHQDIGNRHHAGSRGCPNPCSSPPGRASDFFMYGMSPSKAKGKLVSLVSRQLPFFALAEHTWLRINIFIMP